jgi:hypothetical protein
LQQAFETEFQTHGIEQYNDANFCPRPNTCHIADGGEGLQGGSNQQTRYDVPQDHGLFEFPKQEGNASRACQEQGKICDKGRKVIHASKRRGHSQDTLKRKFRNGLLMSKLDFTDPLKKGLCTFAPDFQPPNLTLRTSPYETQSHRSQVPQNV